jgi:hypothetical protein
MFKSSKNNMKNWFHMHLQGKPNFTSFWFVVEKICLEMCIFSQHMHLRKICFKVFFVETFFMCSQPSFQTYYELTQVVRHSHFTRKNSGVQLLLLQTNKNFILSNFRIFFHVKWICLTTRSAHNMIGNLVGNTWKTFQQKKP